MSKLKANPVHWFEIPVNDLLRAKDFYEYTFDCELTLSEIKMVRMAEFPIFENQKGAPGALVHAKGYEPKHSGTVVYFSVDNIDDVLKRVLDKGGSVLVPKTNIGKYGYIAHFEDCEGNQIGLHSTSE